MLNTYCKSYIFSLNIQNNPFIAIVNESNHKPNKFWVDQRREFYNKLVQKWLDNTDILIYFARNEGKSVITEMFMKG